ncbi:LPXTG cell wall anchor domain-containing protein, partial [Facklamia sp. HMSC062C11]|uniref:LPXTG cell wall anchor domain-containing protein n=1 Tax=Facklamia sp. HMSC062C11 TaxID=1739262 RepID=UPI000A98A13F
KAKTDAEKNPAVTPDEKTGVKDLNNLTDKEKEEVKDKVEKVNPEAKDVTIDDKGNATITYPDGSTNRIPAEDLVFQYEHGEPEETDKPELKIAGIIDPIIPEKTEVGRPGLTQSEIEEIGRKITDANKGNFPEGTQVIVDESGNATIIYPDGSIDTIPWNKLVFHRDEEGGAVETDKPSDESSDKDAKGTEEASSTAKSSAGLLPQTGENDSTVILGAAALSILAGLGLVASRRKEEE